jgi:hypothetical protein
MIDKEIEFARAQDIVARAAIARQIFAICTPERVYNLQSFLYHMVL